MLIRPRVMGLAVAVCLMAPMAVASSAMAHRGRGHFRRHDVLRGKQAQGVCGQVGVPVNGHVRSFHWYRNGAPDSLSALTETQSKELTAACEKLAAAYAVKRKANEAAFKTLWEALKADRTKLDEACPAVTEHHEWAWWKTELSPACKEALQAYWTAAHEAGKAFRTAHEEACKAFRAAVAEFETAVDPILAVLEAAQTEHQPHPEPGFAGPGQGNGGPQDNQGQDNGGPGHGYGGAGQGYGGGPGQGSDGSASGHHWHG